MMVMERKEETGNVEQNSKPFCFQYVRTVLSTFRELTLDHYKNFKYRCYLQNIDKETEA